MANPFQIPLGETAGKVPGGVSGDYCLTLGEIEEGMLDDLAPGDYIQYAQDIDVTGVDYIRFWISGVLPKGWELRFMIDGAPEREIQWAISDGVFGPLFVNVSALAGMHALAFRLERTP